MAKVCVGVCPDNDVGGGGEDWAIIETDLLAECGRTRQEVDDLDL